MASLSRELVFLILQFLEDEKFKEAAHKLEQESGFYFNMKYFEEKALAGDWDEIEEYLSGFTKVNDNRYSMKIFFEIRKQKYFEALDKQDKAKAVDILVKELKVFSTLNADLYKEITFLLTLENFRENEQLSGYGDAKAARSIVLAEMKRLIEANPLFVDRLVSPTLKTSRLRTLINQSLNWQHHLCKNPRPNPDIKTLFTDHTCDVPNGAWASSPVTLPVATVSKSSIYGPLGPRGGTSQPLQPLQPPEKTGNGNAFTRWMANANSLTVLPSIPASSLPVQPNQVSVLKHPRQTDAPGIIEYQNAGNEQQLLKRLRSGLSIDEFTIPVPPKQIWGSVDDLPRVVICTLPQESNVTSMDFHPSHKTLLAVGYSTGGMSLWNVGLRAQLVSKPFKILNMSACSIPLQALIVKDSSISVSCISWSSDGSLIGVAFTKHLVQLHGYHGPNDLSPYLEIDAHAGGVNDLAFCYPMKQLCIVTCGDDNLIKVWDMNGRNLFNFEGHGSPVYSVCPHQKENIQFLLSTAVDGKIKAWLYDSIGCRVDYNAPGKGCTRMLYSDDGNRLFSCGTTRDGECYLVEWNDSEGVIKRTYSGFRLKSAGIVQFDTSKNRFLAAGEDHQIKFWYMDSVTVIATTDAGGGLPSLPRLKFNKEGNLLVTTSEGGLKVLSNAAGLQSIRTIEPRPYEPFKAAIEASISSLVANGSSMLNTVGHVDQNPLTGHLPNLNEDDSESKGMQKQRSLGAEFENSKSWELTEIVDPAQCQTVTLPDNLHPSNKVVCLLYTNSGIGILALGTEGLQKLWKWIRNEQNPNRKPTVNNVPVLWQPNSGHRMINDISNCTEEAIPCVALSKNDSYVVSACGGKISLFNMITFKLMTQFIDPPPAPTCLAFHPLDNNFIAIGMEDSTIQIYNVRVNEVKTTLKGHRKHITSLAFSQKLGALVSSGADAQLLFWNTDSWDKIKSITIPLPAGTSSGETRVQFYSDQVRILVFHESQLAIFDVSKMEWIHKWVPHNALPSPISSAICSSISQLVYATFTDGNIGVFDAKSLELRCRISPSAYLSPSRSNVYPVVVAANPQERNQLAVGLNDGSVKVIEPSESEGKWGSPVPVDNSFENRRPAVALSPAF